MLFVTEGSQQYLLRVHAPQLKTLTKKKKTDELDQPHLVTPMSAYLTKQEDTGCTKNCLSRRAKIFVFLIFIFLLQWMPFLARFLW